MRVFDVEWLSMQVKKFLVGGIYSMEWLFRQNVSVVASVVSRNVHMSRECPEVWHESVEDEGRDDDTILKRYVKAVEGEQVCWGLSRDDVMAPKIANQSPSHILMGTTSEDWPWIADAVHGLPPHTKLLPQDRWVKYISRHTSEGTIMIQFSVYKIELIIQWT